MNTGSVSVRHALDRGEEPGRMTARSVAGLTVFALLILLTPFMTGAQQPQGRARIELIKEVIPSATRIAVLQNPDNASNQPQLRLTHDAASALGVRILSVEAKRLDDIDGAFAMMQATQAMAVVLIA